MTQQIARQYGYSATYREEAKGEGDGGAGAADRGDDFEVVKTDATDEAAVAAKAAEDKAAADKKAADEAAEATRAAEKAAREKDITIPKARFDEATKKLTSRAEAAEKQLEEFRGKQQAATSAEALQKISKEIDTLEDELEAQMAEGTPEKRKELRGKIREKTLELARAEGQTRALEASAVAIEQVNYNALVASTEAEYAFLNFDNKEGFDEELATEVMDLKFAYEATGLGSTDALKKATATLKHKLEAKKAEVEKPKAEAKAKADAEAKAAEAAKATVKAAEDAAAKAEADRKAKAVEKGAEASTKQAPNTAVAGTQDGKPAVRDVTKMSDVEFDKLDEAEKKRMRGD